MKIGSILKLIVAALLAFSLVSTASVFYQLQKMQGDASIVNHAGIVRGATQRLIKLEMYGTRSDALLLKLDKIISGLLSGDASLNLPKDGSEKFRSKVRDVKKTWEKLKEEIKKFRSGSLEKATLVDASEAYFEQTNSMVFVAEAVSRDKVSNLKLVQLLLFICNFILLAAIWIVSARKISIPLAELSGKVRDITANGDLRIRLGASTHDEIGELGKDLNAFMESLAGIMRNFVDYTTKLASSATEIGATTEEMSRGADSQLNEVVRTSSCMEEMASSVREVSRNARGTVESAVSAAKMAKLGSQMVNRTVTDISGVNDSLLRLKERSGEVGKVVRLIGEIASQTNILALNAAIEAARAGEHGRGFDVVAEEIRRLAQKTTDSTAEIATTIELMQIETSDAVNSMESSTTSAIEAGQSIKDIVEGIVTTTDMIQLISSAAAQQARTSEEISDSLQNISGVNKQTAQASREVAKAIQDLSMLAEKLKEVTDRFRV